MSELNLKEITKKLLSLVSDGEGDYKGAYNIRENGSCAARMSSEHIKIVSKTDKDGIEIHVDANTAGETVSIPACITKSDVDDLVYNDFFIGENADITVVAGCGVHSDGEGDSRHNGIHRFFLAKGARVKYIEKQDIFPLTRDAKDIFDGKWMK